MTAKNDYNNIEVAERQATQHCGNGLEKGPHWLPASSFGWLEWQPLQGFAKLQAS